MLISKLKRSSAVLVGVVVLLACGSVYAIQTQIAAQGYLSDSNLQPGMIVRLDSTNPNKVTALEFSNANKMLGVVISANQAALTISQNNSGQEVYISNYGVHDVLVDNQNGPITTGDYISISSLSGIGMKADQNEPIVLGQAAGNFDGVNNVISHASLSAANGQKSNINIGEIPVDISIASNPLAAGAKGVPTFLRNITKFATNKSVSASRIYLSMVCVVAGLIVTVTIIYSGIKNGLISIGRNPLAKREIVLNLVKVIGVSIIIFIASLGAAYAIITR